MKKYICLICFILVTNLFGQEILDRIVAVVDNDVILQSELDFQVAMFAAQRKLDPSNPTPSLKSFSSMFG